MNATKAEQQYKLARWAELLKDQQESPLKLVDWLISNNISKDQYYYWKRKLKQTVFDTMVPSTGFIELPIQPDSQELGSVVPVAQVVQQPSTVVNSPEAMASISIGNAVISINGNASPDFLKTLIGVIANA